LSFNIEINNKSLNTPLLCLPSLALLYGYIKTYVKRYAKIEPFYFFFYEVNCVKRAIIVNTIFINADMLEEEGSISYFLSGKTQAEKQGESIWQHYSRSENLVY